MNNFEPEMENNTEQNKQTAADSMAQEQPAPQAGPQMPPRYPQPPVVYPVQPPQPKGRRVGTITMACALIAVGVLLLIGTFNQSVSVLLLAKLAPIILIVLGIEILLRYFLSKGEKLRYDFLSGFICFILIIGSLGMAVIPELWYNWGPHRSMLEEDLQVQAKQVCAKALKDETNVTSMNIYFDLRHVDLPETMSIDDLRPADYVRAELRMSNSFTSIEEFAKAAQSVLKKIAATGIPFDYINLMTPSVEQLYGYSLYLDDGLGFDLSIEQLLDNISIQYDGYDDGYPYGLEDVAGFAETYMDRFHSFVEEFAEAMPQEYPARCRAFASHYQEQYDAFLNGEEVIFPEDEYATPDVPVLPEDSSEVEPAEDTSTPEEIAA